MLKIDTKPKLKNHYHDDLNKERLINLLRNLLF